MMYHKSPPFVPGLVVLVASCLPAVPARSAPPKGLIERKTPDAIIVGYKDTPLQPWTGGKYHVHDPDRPVPPFVTPGPAGTTAPGGSPPSDAIVLFGGGSLNNWKPSNWQVRDGYVQAGEGVLESKQAFGDCQLHVEWMAPADPGSQFMSRGNSGVLLMSTYEIQIFDSWRGHRQQIYPDGQAASIYGQTPPMVNACRPPGQWQSYDIAFTAPVFEQNKLVKRASVTMFHNGVLVLLNAEIMGPMAHRQIVPYRPHAPKMPLALQGHHSPVRFRNVWVRPLDR